jgi:hypothetical protein
MPRQSVKQEADSKDKDKLDNRELSFTAKSDEMMVTIEEDMTEESLTEMSFDSGISVMDGPSGHAYFARVRLDAATEAAETAVRRPDHRGVAFGICALGIGKMAWLRSRPEAKKTHCGRSGARSYSGWNQAISGKDWSTGQEGGDVLPWLTQIALYRDLMLNCNWGAAGF